jgi:DNA-binding MarR family transcriptional regulator
MENEGLVSRENDKVDLRKTIVTLTEKGRDICDKIAIVYDDCNKVITTALSPEEPETLKAILVKISKNISDSKEG